FPGQTAVAIPFPEDLKECLHLANSEGGKQTHRLKLTGGCVWQWQKLSLRFILFPRWRWPLVYEGGKAGKRTMAAEQWTDEQTTWVI
ncbi:hypothetical protein GOODEAATRI_018983, partial [Goodea atripinnis]